MLTDRRRQTPEQLRARANRILDSAAELIIRWGYSKTTLDDISRYAEVAKGTLYLHWNSRDALFAALLRRERVMLLESLRQRVAAQAVSVGGFVRLMALEVLARPLLKAVMLGDADVLGSLLSQKRANPDASAAVLAATTTYLEILGKHGLLRVDLTPVEQQNVIISAFYGFFFAPPLPEPFRLDVERRADLLAESVQRMLESGRPIAPEDAGQITDATTQYLDRALEVARMKLEMSFEHAPAQ